MKKQTLISSTSNLEVFLQHTERNCCRKVADLLLKNDWLTGKELYLCNTHIGDVTRRFGLPNG